MAQPAQPPNSGAIQAALAGVEGYLDEELAVEVSAENLIFPPMALRFYDHVKVHGIHGAPGQALVIRTPLKISSDSRKGHGQKFTPKIHRAMTIPSYHTEVS